MINKYISFGLSIVVISWLIGITINAFLRKTAFYRNSLSNLNLLPNEKLNKIIGLGVFKWIVKNTPFKYLNQKQHLRNKVEKVDLQNLYNEMTQSETDHLIGFIFASGFVVAKFLSLNFISGLIILGINVLMNLYPSLLQQQNKRRILRFMRKQNWLKD